MLCQLINIILFSYFKPKVSYYEHSSGQILLPDARLLKCRAWIFQSGLKWYSVYTGYCTFLMLNSIITDETWRVHTRLREWRGIHSSAVSWVIKTDATAVRVPVIPPPSGLHQVMGVEFHHLHRKRAIEIPILREQDELHSGREEKTPHLKQFFAGCLDSQ
jgi:hypothetical protein